MVSFLVYLTASLNSPLVLLDFMFDEAGFVVNCSMYPLDGGQARVDLGKVLGIWLDDMKGC